MLYLAILPHGRLCAFLLCSLLILSMLLYMAVCNSVFGCFLGGIPMYCSSGGGSCSSHMFWGHSVPKSGIVFHPVCCLSLSNTMNFLYWRYFSSINFLPWPIVVLMEPVVLYNILLLWQQQDDVGCPDTVQITC
jgi:hypothetical protein